MKNASMIMVTISIVIAIVTGISWIKKKTSYELFYKKMVRQNITDMVKPECLK